LSAPTSYGSCVEGNSPGSAWRLLLCHQRNPPHASAPGNVDYLGDLPKVEVFVTAQEDDVMGGILE